MCDTGGFPNTGAVDCISAAIRSLRRSDSYHTAAFTGGVRTPIQKKKETEPTTWKFSAFEDIQSTHLAIMDPAESHSGYIHHTVKLHANVLYLFL